jgi:primosomal protein N'
MELNCPHCNASLAVRMSRRNQAECLACKRRFRLDEARVAASGARTLTAPKSSRDQLDKMARKSRAR